MTTVAADTLIALTAARYEQRLFQEIVQQVDIAELLAVALRDDIRPVWSGLAAYGYIADAELTEILIEEDRLRMLEREFAARRDAELRCLYRFQVERMGPA